MASHADRLVNPVKARMQAGEVALGMPVRTAGIREGLRT
jgi:hypothetical protein